MTSTSRAGTDGAAPKPEDGQAPADTRRQDDLAAALHLLDLAKRSSDMFAVFDAEDRLCSANPAYCKAFGCDPGDQPFWRDIMRANFERGHGPLIVTDDIEAWLTNAVARRATQAFRCFEAALHGGRWLWITETVAPDGRMLLYASDITALRAESRILRNELDEARRASWTDPLTGVPNRRYVMERLEAWLSTQNAQQDFGNHALAVLDLDHFKRVNDIHGHAIGDKLLISFCRDVVSHIRTIDMFSRIGGEEFLLFMPNCSLFSAKARLEDLQEVIGQLDPNGDQKPLSYTFSAGVVAFKPGKDLHDEIRRADKLLYRAKAEGRARVCS